MAVFDDVSRDKLCIYPHKIKWENGNIPVAEKVEHYVVKCTQKQPLEEELLHFIDCIKTRKAPKTDGNEGLNVLRVLEKAQEKLTASRGFPVHRLKKQNIPGAMGEQLGTIASIKNVENFMTKNRYF